MKSKENDNLRISFVTTRRNILLVACYSLKFARYLLQKLPISKNHSLHVAKFTRYPLQKLLVAKNHSLLVAKFARYSL